MAPPRGSAPAQRWDGLVSAQLELMKDAVEPAGVKPAGVEPTAELPAGAPVEGGEVDDLISKAAVAVDSHATASQLARLRMARLSADAAASLRSAIIGETPTEPGMPRRGVTSGTRLDVQR